MIIYKEQEVQTKTIKGPFGPHHSKKMFKYKGKWHFLKWLSADQYKKERVSESIYTTTRRDDIAKKKNKTGKRSSEPVIVRTRPKRFSRIPKQINISTK